jgi:hypothetical protein
LHYHIAKRHADERLTDAKGHCAQGHLRRQRQERLHQQHSAGEAPSTPMARNHETADTTAHE